ncbi:MAG TPA: DUF4832 domain-containing protein [Acidimicrobiales bacterium]
MSVTEALLWERRFTPTLERFANPDRGFYRFTQTSLGPGARHVPLDLEVMVRDRIEGRISVVFRYFYLDCYRRQATIEPADLDRLAGDLESARRAGVSLVVRFAYSETSGRDAAVGRVVGHIRQLVPIVNAHADAVLALQAGFVGRWGEWYFTDHFASSKRRPWMVSDKDTRRRAQVLDALLEEAPDLLLQVRYPAIARNLMVGLDSWERRIGVHNDGFLASPDDLGTYRAADDREWLEAQSQHAPMGGETCALAPPRSDWDTAAEELQRFHWTYLNADFETKVLQSWGPDALDEVDRRLGYRLRLESGVVRRLQGTEHADPSVRVDLALVNDGYAAPVKPWEVHLVARQGGRVETAPLDSDPRTWLPGRTVRLGAELRLRSSEPCDLALALVEPGCGPNGVGGGPEGDRSSRSIRLAHDDGWDPESGWNRLVDGLYVG